MSEKTIGKCSNCGGNVTVHEIQYSVRPIPPTCQGCGATPRSPVLDMGGLPHRAGADSAADIARHLERVEELRAALAQEGEAA